MKHQIGMALGRNRLLYTFIICLFTVSPIAWGLSDTTPPNLVSLDIDPLIVDVSSGDSSTNIVMDVTDDLSGVSWVIIYFRSPSGEQQQYQWGSLVSGSTLNGTWQFDFNFPQFSEVGVWTASYVRLRDSVGNQASIYTETLAAMGFPTEITIVSLEDTNPPELTSLTIEPAAIDVTGGDQEITVTLGATDSPSGVDLDDTHIAIRSPSSGVIHYGYGWNFSLIDGDNLEGRWQGTITLPQFSEAGTWTVYYIQLRDTAANRLFLYEDDLWSLGLSPEFEIISTPEDTSPPELVDLSLTPILIETTSGPASVYVTLTLTDDLSGVDYCRVRLNSPSAGQYRWAYIRQLAEGTPLAGTWGGDAYFPQYSEEGTWRVDYVYCYDKVRNSKYLDTVAVAGLGLPTEVVVTRPSLTVDGVINDPSAGGIVEDETFGERAQVIVPPDVLSEPTSVAIDVFQDPLDIPNPSGYVAPGTRFVNIHFDPEPDFPLPAPGLTIVLPLPSPLPAGTNLDLYRVDPATGNLVPALDTSGQPVIGVVADDGLSATFSGIASLSTVVGLIAAEEGDLNSDGCVDRGDYEIIITDIRDAEPNNPVHDLNGDGFVNRADARTLFGLFTNPRGAACVPG